MSNPIGEQNLDLKEANVTAVKYDLISEGVYNFQVTLFHDDDGEKGFANWWQVDALNGTMIGIRILVHDHGTVEFTRSQNIETGKETVMVIRGHDEDHGFGGQVIIVDIENNLQQVIDQGSEPLDFSNFTFDIQTSNFSNDDTSKYPQTSIDETQTEDTTFNFPVVSLSIITIGMIIRYTKIQAIKV